MRRVAQLSFDVFAGGGIPKTVDDEDQRPLALTLGVSGTFDMLEPYSQPTGMPELGHGEQVMVTVATLDGEHIASGTGKVQVGFVDKVVEGTILTVRKQMVKL